MSSNTKKHLAAISAMLVVRSVMLTVMFDGPRASLQDGLFLFASGAGYVVAAIGLAVALMGVSRWWVGWLAAWQARRLPAKVAAFEAKLAQRLARPVESAPRQPYR